MPPALCQNCQATRALILRPKDHTKLCKACFITIFEDEIHQTITSHRLFQPGERVAIGASGGKDSTVLASVLKTLNERHNYGLDLCLLSIDEGITGYRDDSLETVKRNAVQYGMPLEILGYKELYGWTMDEVVGQVGKKGNCTYCGVFRRQALDRGAAKLDIKHVVTGHNADDVAETVLMNLLRGDLPRLARATSILTASAHSPIKRSKPLKYAYEKEIVLYAHHKKLDYFSTECIYSPEAFRGSARALIKSLERIRPSAILDIVRSGEDMAKCVPPELLDNGGATREASANGHAPEHVVLGDDDEGGCGSANGRSSGGEMADMEKKLVQEEQAALGELEVEVTSASLAVTHGQRHDRHTTANNNAHHAAITPDPADQQTRSKRRQGRGNNGPSTPKKINKQQMGKCQRCGYLSSQAICKACMLLEGLNKNRPKHEIGSGMQDRSDHDISWQVEGRSDGVANNHGADGIEAFAGQIRELRIVDSHG